MFDDEMEEAISYQGTANVSATDVKVGEKTTVNVTLAGADGNIDESKLYVDIVNAKDKVVLSEVKVSAKKATEVDTSKLDDGKYSVKLYGYNTANSDYQLLAKDDDFVVSKLGAAGDVTGLTVEALDPKTVKVSATDANNAAVEDLKASDFTVKVNGAQMAASEYTVTDMGKGVYQIRANEAFDTATEVSVSVGEQTAKTTVNKVKDHTYDVVFDSNADVWTGKITLTIEVDGKKTPIALEDLQYSGQYGDDVAQNMVEKLNEVGGNVFSAKKGENNWTVRITSSKELQIYPAVTTETGNMVVNVK